VANGNVCRAKYVTKLPFSKLSAKATQADSFEDFPSSLMSVGQVSDDGTVSIFHKDGVTVHKEEDVLITCHGKPILIGIRDKHGRYRIPLMQQKGQGQPRKPSKKARQTLRQANSVYDLPSIEQAIKWMHAVCGYPVKSTWMKAVKVGNFVGWPLLTETNISKYYPETDETPKGHMNQQRKNVRSTKKPFEQCNVAAALRGKKVKDIFMKTYDFRETVFSDQTGQFPTRSQSGNKYIMVMVEIDSNAILVEPMKSRKEHEMMRAYDVLVKRLQNANIHPRKHVLDNEISANMKEHIKKEYKFEIELVPPGCHRCNAAEVAIRNFKAHFLSVLAGTAESFPKSLWDRLLPQTELTLNLLRQSNATPTVSAYAHLAGPFDYNKMPLAPRDVKCRCMRKRINAVRGHTIHSMGGTCSRHQSTIECITVILGR
jgi:antitoxin (DNA-binding transcriptional repressor) of toxin-antitoxin stability system